MTVRLWMQWAGIWLWGAIAGYALAIWHGAKERRRHQLQVDHLRTKLRTRM